MTHSKVKEKSEQQIRPIEKTRTITGKIEELLIAGKKLDRNRYDDVYKAATETHTVVALSLIRSKKLDEFDLAGIIARLALQVEKHQLNVAILESKISLIEAYFQEQKGIVQSTNKGGNKFNAFMFDIAKEKVADYKLKRGKFPSGGWLTEKVSLDIEKNGKDLEKKKGLKKELSAYEEAYLAEYLKRKSKVKDGRMYLPITTANSYLRRIKNN